MGWGDKWDDFTEEDKIALISNAGNNAVKLCSPSGLPVELIIPIKGGWSNVTVQAILIGDLAVHDSIEDDGDSWQVTHVPTLTRFDKAVPEVKCTQEQLLMWCWKVQQSTDLWQAINSYNNQNYKNIPASILEDLKNYCLSVAIE